MTAPTHLCFAVLNGLVLASFATATGGQPLSFDLTAAGNALALGLGALCPDLDSPASAISRAFPPARLIHRRWQHRTLLHSLLGLLLAASIVHLVPTAVRLLLSRPSGPTGTLFFVVGYTSHLLADCLTVRGVPLLHPYPISFAFPSPEHLRLRTGLRKHELVFAGLCLAASLVYLPVVRGGGAEASLHRAMGTLPAAYEDWRKMVGQEAWLSFKGFYALSKEPLDGQGTILEASPGRFMVFFRGEVLLIGEANTPIVATAAHCLPTGHPIPLSAITVTHEPWGGILDRLPASVLVSGELIASHPFVLGSPAPIPASTTATGSALRMVFAQRHELAALDVQPRTDAEQLTAELQALEASLRSLAQSMADAIAGRRRVRSPYERDQLFGRISDLRRKQTMLESQLERARRDLEAARAVHVFFSGQLTLRAHSVDQADPNHVNNSTLLYTPAVSEGSCLVRTDPPTGLIAPLDNAPSAGAVLQSSQKGGAL